MDKIFGQMDAVDAGEQQEAKEISLEERAAVVRTAGVENDMEKAHDVMHVEASKST